MDKIEFYAERKKLLDYMTLMTLQGKIFLLEEETRESDDILNKYKSIFNGLLRSHYPFLQMENDDDTIYTSIGRGYRRRFGLRMLEKILSCYEKSPCFKVVDLYEDKGYLHIKVEGEQSKKLRKVIKKFEKLSFRICRECGANNRIPKK